MGIVYNTKHAAQGGRVQAVQEADAQTTASLGLEFEWCLLQTEEPAWQNCSVRDSGWSVQVFSVPSGVIETSIVLSQGLVDLS